MKCEQVQERLSEFIDGELSAEMKSQCQAHLADCPNCQCQHRTFLAVSELMATADGSPVGAGDWGRLETRLDQTLVSPATPAPTGRPRGRLMLGAIVALAASALVMIVTTWRSDSGTRIPPAIVASHAVIDWREFIDGSSSQPQVALRRLSEKFAGREASLTEAEGLLGYSPAVNRALADGVQLVSTRTLRLPECSCPDGGCQCASGGCNSSVSLCKRNDGSQFLLIEHCACQRISFGGLVVKPDAAGSRKYGIVKTENRLAATWLLANRRLVAIGLNDGNEVRSLVEGTVEL